MDRAPVARELLLGALRIDEVMHRRSAAACHVRPGHDAAPARRARPGETWDETTKTGADGTVGIDPALGQIAASCPPIIVNDVIIVGNSSIHGYYPIRVRNLPSYIRGFDIHTGKQLWKFNLVPEPGEPGSETWLNGSKPGDEGVGKNDAWARSSTRCSRSRRRPRRTGAWKPDCTSERSSSMPGPERLFTARFALMFSFSFTVFLSAFQLLPTAPFHILALGGTPSEAGLFLAFLTYASAVSAPFMGGVADRLGKRRVLEILEAQLAETDEKIETLQRFRSEIQVNIDKIRLFIEQKQSR